MIILFTKKKNAIQNKNLQCTIKKQLMIIYWIGAVFRTPVIKIMSKKNKKINIFRCILYPTLNNFTIIVIILNTEKIINIMISLSSHNYKYVINIIIC